MKLLSALFLVFLLMQSPVRAQEASDAEDTIEASVGLFLVSLSDFNMANQSYRAVFWAWFIHDSPDYKPLETVEIVNARSITKEYNYRDIVDDQIIDGARFTVEMQHDWDVGFYPFDRQHFRLRFEDTDHEIDELALATDIQGSKVQPGIRLPGWDLVGFSGSEATATYPSTFGHPVEEGEAFATQHANIVFDIDVRRLGWGVFIGTFATTVLGFLLTLVMYFIHPKELEVRFALVVAALFSVVGDRYNLGSILPPPTGPTLADAVVITTLIALFFAVVLSTKNHNAFLEGDDPVLLRRQSIRAAKLTAVVWACINTSLILWASAST